MNESTRLVKDTDFFCKLCKTAMKFNIGDSHSFMSKTEKKEFFGMQLATFRVYHDIGNERHHNAVLVDSEGSFRGHVDAYSENVESTKKIDFWLPTDLEGLQKHKHCDILIMMDKDEGWVLDVVCPKNLRPLQIVNIIDKKLAEAKEIYNTFPETLAFELADKTIDVLIHKNQFILVSFKNSNYPPEIKHFFSGILEYEFSHRKGLPNSNAFNTCMKLLERKNIFTDALIRLITDEFLQTPITLPFELDLPFILKELKNHYKLPEKVFMSILDGEKSILNLLDDSKYQDKYPELISIIDFGRKITEIVNRKAYSTEIEVKSSVKDILLKYKVVAELDKGTKPKKIAHDIFKKELKEKNPEVVKRLIAEMIIQTLNENSKINSQIEELIGYLQDRAFKEAERVSTAIF